MSLLSSIQSIVSTVYPTYTFMFASEFNANRESFDLENAEFPLIILNNLLENEEEMQENANVLSKETVNFLAFNRDSFDSTDTQSNVIVDAMKVVSRRIMSNIYQLDAVRLKEGEKLRWNFTPIIKGYNGIYTGVLCRSNVQYNINESICLVPDP